MIIHNLGTGQSFGTGRRDGRLFGSATLPAFAFNPPTPPSAPMPTAAPTTQMGLLGADPSRARADAFLRSLGAMASGLLMAGAPSTDPSQRGKGLAMAFGAQPQAFQQDLARQRAANVQKMNLQMAQARAARAAQERKGLDQLAAQYGLPAGTSEAVIKSLIESQAKGRLDANQTVTQERAIRGELVKATGTAQDTVDAYKRMEAIFYNSAAKTPELFRIKDENGNISAITIDKLGISGAADLALIFNFMKAQDPRSVVREGEFAMAANTGGFGEYIKSLISKVEDGQMLTNAQRANLMAQGRNQFIQADATIAKQLKRFGDLADRYKDKGISKENIVGGFVRYKPLLGAALNNLPKSSSTIPKPKSKATAPAIGSSNSQFKLPNPVTGN